MKCATAAMRGFTLLEVLAALALLAIAFVMGLTVLGRTVHNADQGVQRTTALERARTLLAEQAMQRPLRNRHVAGRFDDGMRWRTSVRAMAQDTGGDMRLYRLDVRVQYGDDRRLHLSTERAQAAGASTVAASRNRQAIR